MNSVEMRQATAKLVADARGIFKASEGPEKRGMTAEEVQQYDRLMADVTLNKTRIAQAEALERAEAELQAPANPRSNSPAPVPAIYSPPSPVIPVAELRAIPTNDRERRALPEYSAAFSRYLVRHFQGLQELHPSQVRALQMDSDILGGSMVPPTQFVDQLIKFIDDNVLIRQFASKETLIGAKSLGKPSLDTDVSDADWTVELGTGAEDSSLRTGGREFVPNPLAKKIKVSNTLIRHTAGGAEALVRNRLAYKFAITEEKAFLAGSGSGEPLGLFTASASGIPTTRDVSTGNSTTAIGQDNFMECYYALKAPYRLRASWVLHRNAVKQAMLLKDGNGQYIWRQGLVAGQPDTILTRPVLESEYAPSTFTTGLYVGLCGDLSYYHIVDTMTMTVQRLIELYAETDQVGFIGRLECDGMPVLGEAFSRMKLA